MASSGKKKTTMAKMTRENKVRERQMEKKARRDARKNAVDDPDEANDGLGEPFVRDETVAQEIEAALARLV